MKKSMDNIDDLFKQHFEQTTTKVADKEGLWASIGRERSSKKGILIWFFMLGLIGSSLGIYSVINNTETDKSEIEKSTDFKESKPGKTRLQDIRKLNTTEPIAATQQLGNIVSENKSKEKSLTEPNAFLRKETSQDSNLKEKTNVSKVEKEPILSNKTEKTVKNSKNFSARNNDLVGNTQAKIANASIINSTFQLVNYTEEERNLELDELDLNEVNRKWDKCYVKAPGKLFLDGYGQASVPFEKIYQQNDFDGIDAYQALWEERMTPFMSYQAGVLVGYQFPWKGYVSGGISYQHFETKYENMQTVTERITVFDEMAYFYIDDAGETVWVADSVTLTNVYDRQQTKANQHQLWHVPIQLGYIKEFNNWRLGGNIEAAVNFSKTYQGQFIKFDNTVVELDKTEAKRYFSSTIGVNLSVGAHLGYMLNEHWEIYANPRFRTNNLSFLESEHPLDIKYQFAGLRTGLKYWF